MFRHTKLICTIGPAVSDYKMMLKLIDAGMNVARINFSHGTHAEHGEVIANLKKAREEKGLPLAIMLDTKGPEIRVGMLPEEGKALKKGMKLFLVPCSKEKVKEDEIPIAPGHILGDLDKGLDVLFDDGYITSKILEVGEERVQIQIKNDGVLKSQKGVNIPFADLNLPAMTEQDIADIQFGCEQDVDYIAASFIRSAEHVLEIRQLLCEKGKDAIRIISKIESALGVNNFGSILQVSDGIMVARGDLGVELPLTQVPKLQKMMIRKSYEAFKPVITATQMLESMIHCPLPTRAEVSDVANAIYDSTSAVMLSGETAVGKYPIEAVKMMASIVSEAERDFDYPAFFFKSTSLQRFNDISSSVALAAVRTSYSSYGKALFAFTNSGFTGRAISRFRPKMPIIALTPSMKTFNQLALNWGVCPHYDTVDNETDAFRVASCFAIRKKFVHYGDLVVVTSGSPFGVSGTTNMMLVDNIGDVLVRGKPVHGTEQIHGEIYLLHAHDSKKGVHTEGKIVVLSKCDESYYPLLEGAAGLIVHNHADDKVTEVSAKAFGESLNIPVLLRADGATILLKDGLLVTLDVDKGIVFRGKIDGEIDFLKSCPK